MHKNKKLKFLAVSFFLTVFAISAAITGILFSQFGDDFKSSVLRIPETQVFSNDFIAQLTLPSEPIIPETICSSYVEPKKPEYQGEFIMEEMNHWAKEGGDFSVSLYIKNTGNTAWFGDLSGCEGRNFMRLGTARDQDHPSIFYNPADPRWLAPNRILMMEEIVEPGEIGTFTFSSKAPRVSDIFREYFQPIVEGKSWLTSKQETAHVDLYVGFNDENQVVKLFYLGKTGQASQLDLNGQPAIHIDVSEQKLRFKIGETVVREYQVSTGADGTPTPLGRFKILNKQKLRISAAWPHYRMPMWQGFTKWGHGLHALPYLANDKGIFWNEALNHIGQPVSHGCVRLLPEDAEDLYSLTQVGMDIVISS